MSAVLVLDKSWNPVEFTSVFDALVRVYKDKMGILDHNYQLHTWESWVDTWKDAADYAQSVELIHSANFSIAAPEVVVLKNYTATKFRKRAKLCRRNLLLRDNYTCQYCKEQFKSKFLNFDHVLPKAQEGKSAWKNLVTSCIPCNQKKGNRTPGQAGMPLLKKPWEPRWFELHEEADKCKLNSWKDLLGEMYWNAQLET